MPTDACVFFYSCTGCGVRLRPAAGDCCVFCSYGSEKCPPIQLGEVVRSGRIVYESNGELQLFDTRTGKGSAIAITVPDDGLAKRPSRIAVGAQIRDLELSPKGERALFAARGDIFTAPIEKGPTRNLTHSSGAHDKWPRWSPDGRRIAFISDMSGEDELYLVAQDGTGTPEALTKGSQAFRYAPAWSPDGTRIAFGDKDGRVYVVKVADRTMTQIVDAARGQIQDYTWAPRGHVLAFSMNGPNGQAAVHIWNEAIELSREAPGSNGRGAGGTSGSGGPDRSASGSVQSCLVIPPNPPEKMSSGAHPSRNTFGWIVLSRPIRTSTSM